MRRSWFRPLLRRRLAVIMLLILQLWFLVFIFKSDSYIAGVLQNGAHVISGSRAVMQIKKDYLETLKECHQITPEECKEKLPVRLFQ